MVRAHRLHSLIGSSLATKREPSRTSQRTSLRKEAGFKMAKRSSVLGLLVTGVIVASCSGVTLPTDPADAGLDAEVAPDTSTPEASVPDSATADAQQDAQDAKSDALVPDADAKDALADVVDANEPNDATVDANGLSDATADANDATADAGALPPPLFMPGESGALYEMRAVCAIEHNARVGTAGSCCRASAFSATTTCETMLREEPDGAGSLRVVVEPMQGCSTVLTGENCTRSGTLSRCDSNGLVCPANSTAQMGGPELVAGTYARRLMRLATSTVPVNHYWIPNCPVGPTGLSVPASPCSPPGVDINTSPMGPVLTTLERTGAGVFTARRSWSEFREASCSAPYFDAPVSLANARFIKGQAQGGTFNFDKYLCTYTLTKK